MQAIVFNLYELKKRKRKLGTTRSKAADEAGCLFNIMHKKWTVGKCKHDCLSYFDYVENFLTCESSKEIKLLSHQIEITRDHLFNRFKIR